MVYDILRPLGNIQRQQSSSTHAPQLSSDNEAILEMLLGYGSNGPRSNFVTPPATMWNNQNPAPIPDNWEATVNREGDNQFPVPLVDNPVGNLFTRLQPQDFSGITGGINRKPPVNINAQKMVSVRQPMGRQTPRIFPPTDMNRRRDFPIRPTINTSPLRPNQRQEPVVPQMPRSNIFEDIMRVLRGG